MNNIKYQNHPGCPDINKCVDMVVNLRTVSFKHSKDTVSPPEVLQNPSSSVCLCPGHIVQITVPLSLCVWVQTSVCLSPAPSAWTPLSPSSATLSSNVRPATPAGSTETVCRYSVCVCVSCLFIQCTTETCLQLTLVPLSRADSLVC